MTPFSIEKPADEGARPATRPTMLFVTSNKSYAKTEIHGSSIDLAKASGDREGVQCLGAAVERDGANGQLSKLIVVGDSNFISNGFLRGGNSDFFMGAMDWLVDREVTLPARPMNEVKLNLSRKELFNLLWINMAGIPSVALIFGVFIWYRRRK